MANPRWTAQDVNVVEGLAVGAGMLLASVIATIGWLTDHPSLIVGSGLGGLAVIIRSIWRARRLPWWHAPDREARDG